MIASLTADNVICGFLYALFGTIFLPHDACVTHIHNVVLCDDGNQYYVQVARTVIKQYLPIINYPKRGLRVT